jgi:signal transduction histidine kinase
VDAFLDLIGHEMRTPITALKGQVQLLQRRLRKQPDRDADLAELGKMMYQIVRLNHELDVYLEASHIARKRFDLLPTQADIGMLADRLVDMYAGAANAHSISVDTGIAPIVGLWDVKRLLMALEALLTNALKFSRGGEVAVRLAHEEDVVRVEVADRGIGVLPAERSRIFQAYERGSNAENAGAGLGLYVARETIRRHGGRMGMRSRPGGGSVFWFTVPLAPATGHAQTPAASEPTRTSGAMSPQRRNTQAARGRQTADSLR